MTAKENQLLNWMLGIVSAGVIGVAGAFWAMRAELSELKGEVSGIKMLVLQKFANIAEKK